MKNLKLLCSVVWTYSQLPAVTVVCCDVVDNRCQVQERWCCGNEAYPQKRGEGLKEPQADLDAAQKGVEVTNILWKGPKYAASSDVSHHCADEASD